ncbi:MULTISPECIES: GNAT family N-acetyltransferase [unclassified Paenibacillus]|uniref:GNAT family N-acetyltransferase n=1 Tax=unclassified Paenibacillus TaxID=185978 RepID=UPI001C0F9524|nr:MULTISPECIES: GNAT family N-acetyltransferase [unclassified Paenibacillus]MBU5443253.1 GNAT family N-acetyltransferase [Paenibacillus sp. MSJ-34]CAH0121938.1 Acetyltransferase YpeA [Paenibacillus sp. CECT 9249]
MEIKVRLATEQDAGALARLNQDFNGGDRRCAAEITDSMRNSDELIAVAEMGGQVVGFGCAQSFKSFCYQELQGEITELYIEPSARRKGAAASILSCLEEHLASRGVAEIKVLTGMDNETAIKTYERCNYEKDDELLLKKRLT